MINEVNAERGEKSQASPIGLIGRAVAKWLREKGDEQDKLCSDVWNRRVIDGFRLVHDVDRIQRDVGKDAPARMAYIPPPGNLPGISGAERVRPKTWVSGRKRPRWIDTDGNIYEWDLQHGRLERYDRRGNHTGEFDHTTGRQISDPVPGRRVEP
jgi:hypothetical protein